MGATAVVLIIAFIFLFFSRTNIGSGSDPANALPGNIIVDSQVSKLFNVKCEPMMHGKKYRSDAMMCIFKNISGSNLAEFIINARSYDKDGLMLNDNWVILHGDIFLKGESAQVQVHMGTSVSGKIYDEPRSKVIFYVKSEGIMSY